MAQRIAIQIRDKIATCLTEIPIVCGNSDYIVDFSFDEEWNGHSVKTARFIANCEYTDVVFEGNECPMPIISNAKVAWVGVFAGNLSTSTPAIVHCKQSILDGDGVPAPPKEDVYAQIMKMLNDLDEAAGLTEEEVKAIIAEVGGGLTEEQVKQIIETVTADNVTEDEVKEIVATETEGKFTPTPTGLSNYYGDGYIAIQNTNRKSFGQRMTTGVYVAEYTIPYRVGGGALCVGNATADAHAVPFKQFKEATAPIAENANKIADNTKRIENLESALLTFYNDKSSAYEKDVPVGVGEYAILASIGGATKTSKNLLDPSLFGLPVNEDGSFHYTADYGEGSGGHNQFATISLSAGTYYLSYEEANLDGELYSEGYGFFVDNVIIGSSIVLDKQTDCVVGFVGGGIGKISADIYVMLSTDPDAEFEPYFEGERYGKVTKIESISAQLLDPSELEVGYYDTSTGVIQKAATFRSFVIPLKAGEYTISSDLELWLARRIIGSKTENFAVATPYTFTVENDGDFGFSFRLDTGATGNIADARIMLNKGKEVMPYAEIGTVIDTFTIPSEIQALDGYGKEGFVLSLYTKSTSYNGTATDVSQYLTGYDKFKTLKVQGGGRVRFVNEDKIAVPSHLSTVKAKE